MEIIISIEFDVEFKDFVQNLPFTHRRGKHMDGDKKLFLTKDVRRDATGRMVDPRRPPVKTCRLLVVRVVGRQ